MNESFCWAIAEKEIHKQKIRFRMNNNILLAVFWQKRDMYTRRDEGLTFLRNNL